jgi:hypothetical protein
MSSSAEQIQHPDVSAARTTTGNGATFLALNYKGGIFSIDISAATGTTPTLVVRLQGNVDGTNWFDIDATNAITVSTGVTGTARFVVYPGITAAANASANTVLPMNLRFAWVIGGTTPSFTFGTHADLIL